MNFSKKNQYNYTLLSVCYQVIVSFGNERERVTGTFDPKVPVTRIMSSRQKSI